MVGEKRQLRKKKKKQKLEANLLRTTEGRDGNTLGSYCEC